MIHPKISIVTPSYNQGYFIEETINSVLNQGYPNLEYIIMDGGSTDNTVEIIKKYASHLKYWISEKDAGQANAINKGLQHCTGEIFNWLNSDDYLEPDALNKIAKAFNSGAAMVAGSVRVFRGTETLEIVIHKNLTAKGLMFWLNGVKFVQPGVWMRRELLYKCGGINEQLHFAFDWDLYIRYISEFNKIHYLDDLLIHFRYHDNSKTVSQQYRFQEEEWEIIKLLAAQGKGTALKKMAANRLEISTLMPYLQSVTKNNDLSKFAKVIKLLKTISKKNIVHLRVTLGAVRIVLNQ